MTVMTVFTRPSEEACAPFPPPLDPFLGSSSSLPNNKTGFSLEALLVILKCPPPLHSGAHMPLARLFVLDAGGQPGSGGPAHAVP